MIARRMMGSLAVASLLAIVLIGCQDSASLSGIGTLALPIRALGWLNGPAPDDAEMAGNVVVIDCFASS